MLPQCVLHTQISALHYKSTWKPAVAVHRALCTYNLCTVRAHQLFDTFVWMANNNVVTTHLFRDRLTTCGGQCTAHHSGIKGFAKVCISKYAVNVGSLPLESINHGSMGFRDNAVTNQPNSFILYTDQMLSKYVVLSQCTFVFVCVCVCTCGQTVKALDC